MSILPKPIIVVGYVTGEERNPAYIRGGTEPRWIDVTRRIELTIDVHRLLWDVGESAIRNKSGTSRARNGALKAKVVKERRK
jgi:hypothetical protein